MSIAHIHPFSMPIHPLIYPGENLNYIEHLLESPTNLPIYFSAVSRYLYPKSTTL